MLYFWDSMAEQYQTYIFKYKLMILYVALRYCNGNHKAIKVGERGSRSHSWSIFSILHVPGGGKRLWAEIRFPDAGKDERKMPAETGGSWGV